MVWIVDGQDLAPSVRRAWIEGNVVVNLVIPRETRRR
jgi:hypothetical protein